MEPFKGLEPLCLRVFVAEKLRYLKSLLLLATITRSPSVSSPGKRESPPQRKHSTSSIFHTWEWTPQNRTFREPAGECRCPRCPAPGQPVLSCPSGKRRSRPAGPLRKSTTPG